MLPSATFIARDPRLVPIIVLLSCSTANTAYDFFVLVLLLIFLNRLLALLGLSPLRGLRTVLELIEHFRMLALGSPYGSAGFLFAGHLDGWRGSKLDITRR